MTGTIILIFLTLGSLLLNAFLIWYITKILSKLLYTSDNLGDLYMVFSLYGDFIKELYEMDMFYGEPILEELIRKTKMVREEIEKFEEIYELTTDVVMVDEEEADGYEEAVQET